MKVYKEYLLPPLLESVLALSGPRTTLLVSALPLTSLLKDAFLRQIRNPKGMVMMLFDSDVYL